MSFNLYGLLVGLAIVVALLLIEKKVQQLKLDFSPYSFKFFIVFICGIVFARAWHVVTDFHLYQDNLLAAVQFWNGGMSILGAILGGVIGLYLISARKRKTFLKLVDIAIFGLPFAQSIGRWGNYFNKELYGWPTDLPWGIMIDGKTYHPIFLYESLLTFAFGVYAWIVYKNSEIGTGKIAVRYIAYYALIRFLLDFLRIEKTLVNGWLGVNQLVLLFVFIVSISFLAKKEKSSS